MQSMDGTCAAALASLSRMLLVPLTIHCHSMETLKGQAGWEARGSLYMMLHCVAPQQSLIIASPALAMVGLLGGGSAFFSAGLPAMFKTGHHQNQELLKPFLPTSAPKGANLPCPLSTLPEFFSSCLNNTLCWFETAQKVSSLQGRVLGGAKHSIHLKGRVKLYLVQGRCPFSLPWVLSQSHFTVYLPTRKGAEGQKCC